VKGGGSSIGGQLGELGKGMHARHWSLIGVAMWRRTALGMVRCRGNPKAIGNSAARGLSRRYDTALVSEGMILDLAVLLELPCSTQDTRAGIDPAFTELQS
jgi:hypothetical protein